MPCRSDYMEPSSGEIAASIIAEYKAKLDKLTAENDVLRETILGLLTDANYTVPPKILKKIEVAQVKHRKEDLKRLEKTFRDYIARYDTSSDEPGTDSPSGIVYERLGRVMAADPAKPLKPQLQFDPDEF